MEELKKTKILVVDDETDIRELVTFYLETEFNVQTLEAENGEIAKKILEENKDISIVVCDYSMPILNGGGLFQHILQKQIPVKFILLSTYHPKTKPEFKNEQPDGFVEKPDFSDSLKKVIHQFLKAPSKILQEYVRVSVYLLFRFGTCPFPLFAMLSESKYLKIVHENEAFGKDELERFKKKNISYLYLRGEDALPFFNHQLKNYISLLTNNLSSTSSITIAEDINYAIHDMASSLGFSEELEKMTKLGVEHALKTMSQAPALNELIKNLNFTSVNYLATHSARLPYLANHITELMGWQFEGTGYKMAMAALLHDSTLLNPIHARYESENELILKAGDGLQKSELENFINHPTKAAEIASKFKGVPPDVDIIIAQHHERCDGTGFPNKINHQRIAPLSCAFIIAHDLLCYYENNQQDFNIQNFIDSKQELYSLGTFRKILASLAGLKF